MVTQKNNLDYRYPLRRKNGSASRKIFSKQNLEVISMAKQNQPLGNSSIPIWAQRIADLLRERK